MDNKNQEILSQPSTYYSPSIDSNTFYSQRGQEIQGATFKRKHKILMLIFIILILLVILTFIPIPYYQSENAQCKIGASSCPAKGWYLGMSLWQKLNPTSITGGPKEESSASINPSPTITSPLQNSPARDRNSISTIIADCIKEVSPLLLSENLISGYRLATGLGGISTVKHTESNKDPTIVYIEYKAIYVSEKYAEYRPTDIRAYPEMPVINIGITHYYTEKAFSGEWYSGKKFFENWDKDIRDEIKEDSKSPQKDLDEFEKTFQKKTLFGSPVKILANSLLYTLISEKKLLMSFSSFKPNIEDIYSEWVRNVCNY